ncbi:MAG: 4-hydroxy-tetrahydrodipicolinate synthase [Proteobacteria bacterium]|nr:MAG: 4-hydroxy-tetrahydrodipicolinate synthase [Pseudomonadota bacterium]
MRDLSGVLTALITPFKQGEIDWSSFRKLLRFQLDGGVQGFVVSGTTAESPTLSKEEKKKLFDFVKSESGGQATLVMGTGSNSTSETIEATKAASQWRADAALVVVPYYNKPPQRGLFQHFQKVAECSELPIILYNVPGRTITKLELDTIVELSKIKNIVGIKDATGDMELGTNQVLECANDFMVVSGDDGTFLDLTSRGGKGVISVAAHILPKEFSSWCSRARKGDGAPREEFMRFNDLNNYLYVEANPIPIKMALHLMGLIESPELRLPLVQLSEPYTLELKTKMKAVGLL